MKQDDAKALLEWLRARGVLVPGTEFRYGADLVQVIRDGKVVATINPSTLR